MLKVHNTSVQLFLFSSYLNCCGVFTSYRHAKYIVFQASAQTYNCNSIIFIVLNMSKNHFNCYNNCMVDDWIETDLIHLKNSDQYGYWLK